MENNIKENTLKVIENLQNKEFGFYFFVLDTKGNPTGSIANIYEHVKVLNQIGYKAYILHEKNDYTKVGSWLGEEYDSLPHVSIEAKDNNIGPQDFVIIPEILSDVMNQWKSIPAKRIVFCNAYEYILEIMSIGHSWGAYGITDAITTNQKQADYIKSLFPLVNSHIVPVSIPKYFKNSDKPKKPIITIYTRNQKDAIKIANAFYLQNPVYKWITFRDLRGISRENFAKELSEACLSVWVDDISGFGTFPIESIECDTPVIGKIPNLIPEWMEESINENEIKIKQNGIWTNNILAIPELISEYIRVWLEDSVPGEIIDEMEKTKGLYTEEIQVEKIKEVYSKLVESRIDEFNNAISQIK